MKNFTKPGSPSRGSGVPFAFINDVILRAWIFLSSLGFAVLLLALLYTSREPLCIHSKTVKRIDRVTSDRREEIFSCDRRQEISYSSHWSENASRWSSRLTAIENYLENLKFRPGALNVVLFVDQKNVFELKDQVLYLSENLFEAPGLLEMSVIKSWVYMSNAAKDWHDRLQSQLLVQSVFLHWQGREFSETGAKILSNNRLLWPQNIKASTNQCRFAQRFSSEIFFCLPEKDHLDANTQQLLIERAWMDTYKSFGWKEKNWLLRSFVDSARAPHDLEKSTEEQNLKSMMSFLLGKLQKKKEFQESSWGPRFLAELTQKFDRIGVGEVFEPTEFDFVFLFDEEIKPGSSFISSFQNFFQKNKGDRVALLDQKQMFLTESGVSYPRRSLKKWKSKTLIWTTCAPPSFRAINSLIPHSDQLLLIQDCSKSEDLSWKSLFHEGIGAFAKSNPKVSFIQFHLPSLSLRRLELESVGNVFKSFSETRLSRLSQIFGWQKVEWKKEIQAYTPKAYIDAIPLFRWPLAQEI